MLLNPLSDGTFWCCIVNIFISYLYFERSHNVKKSAKCLAVKSPCSDKIASYTLQDRTDLFIENHHFVELKTFQFQGSDSFGSKSDDYRKGVLLDDNVT